MAKWKLPEGREPITAMESADLVLRMHDKLAAGFAKGDRIAELEELVEACKADAREAEAYAAELEAKHAELVSAVKDLLHDVRYSVLDEQSDGVLGFELWEEVKKFRRVIHAAGLAELKGQDDE